MTLNEGSSSQHTRSLAAGGVYHRCPIYCRRIASAGMVMIAGLTLSWVKNMLFNETMPKVGIRDNVWDCLIACQAVGVRSQPEDSKRDLSPPTQRQVTSNLPSSPAFSSWLTLSRHEPCFNIAITGLRVHNLRLCRQVMPSSSTGTSSYSFTGRCSSSWGWQLPCSPGDIHAWNLRAAFNGWQLLASFTVFMNGVICSSRCRRRILISRQSALCNIVHLVSLAISYACLFQFGVSLLNTQWPERIRMYTRWLPLVVLLTWTVIIFFVLLPLVPAFAEWQAISNALARYFIGFPAALLAAYGLRRQAVDRIAPLGVPHIVQSLRLAGFMLLLYALFGGLIPPPVPFFPGNVLNIVTFWECNRRAGVALPICHRAGAGHRHHSRTRNLQS